MTKAACACKTFTLALSILCATAATAPGRAEERITCPPRLAAFVAVPEAGAEGRGWAMRDHVETTLEFPYTFQFLEVKGELSHINFYYKGPPAYLTRTVVGHCTLHDTSVAPPRPVKVCDKACEVRCP